MQGGQSLSIIRGTPACNTIKEKTNIPFQSCLPPWRLDKTCVNQNYVFRDLVLAKGAKLVLWTTSLGNLILDSAFKKCAINKYEKIIQSRMNLSSLLGEYCVDVPLVVQFSHPLLVHLVSFWSLMAVGHAFSW